MCSYKLRRQGDECDHNTNKRDQDPRGDPEGYFIDTEDFHAYRECSYVVVIDTAWRNVFELGSGIAVQKKKSDGAAEQGCQSRRCRNSLAHVVESQVRIPTFGKPNYLSRKTCYY
jgi:hypothetical protein